MLSAPSRLCLPSDATGDTVLDDIGFWAWVAVATSGDHVVYHRGFLGVDVSDHGSPLTMTCRQRLRDVAAAALRAAEEKLVHLVQARLEHNFAYIAIARPKSEPRRSSAHSRR